MQARCQVASLTKDSSYWRYSVSAWGRVSGGGEPMLRAASSSCHCSAHSSMMEPSLESPLRVSSEEAVSLLMPWQGSLWVL